MRVAFGTAELDAYDIGEVVGLDGAGELAVLSCDCEVDELMFGSVVEGGCPTLLLAILRVEEGREVTRPPPGTASAASGEDGKVDLLGDWADDELEAIVDEGTGVERA